MHTNDHKGGSNVVLMSEYLAPTDLNEALEMAAAGARTIVAGGTDFYPARVGVPVTEAVVDISGIAELRGIERQDRAYRIGALTSWSDIANADLPRCFDALRSSARQVGGVQTERHRENIKAVKWRCRIFLSYLISVDWSQTICHLPSRRTHTDT